MTNPERSPLLETFFPPENSDTLEEMAESDRETLLAFDELAFSLREGGEESINEKIRRKKEETSSSGPT
jgi:hypothetical protein